MPEFILKVTYMNKMLSVRISDEVFSKIKERSSGDVSDFIRNIITKELEPRNSLNLEVNPKLSKVVKNASTYRFLRKQIPKDEVQGYLVYLISKDVEEIKKEIEGRRK